MVEVINFDWLPLEKENTGCVLRSLRELVFSISSACRFTLEYSSTSHGHLVSFFPCLPSARVSYFKLSQFVWNISDVAFTDVFSFLLQDGYTRSNTD